MFNGSFCECKDTAKKSMTVEVNIRVTTHFLSEELTKAKPENISNFINSHKLLIRIMKKKLYVVQQNIDNNTAN